MCCSKLRLFLPHARIPLADGSDRALQTASATRSACRFAALQLQRLCAAQVTAVTSADLLTLTKREDRGVDAALYLKEHDIHGLFDVRPRSASFLPVRAHLLCRSCARS